ncbi:GNAT family N-acetyltransferase [Sulfitobacter sp. D35]|uniref:GNAT family N-acetyltransferase n=1 Tax=Sulfitobacter sp. D35 TaxID=3083252 RepID=UPI00296FFD22|nr:GNAT family N-acetyltransferase [Sulfitobacter sp. D35]MDW4497992.1 GNAT family N-acetyltransferase [Sulfitobacter sp. D35]
MPQSESVRADQIDEVRAFNRFHTRLVGALNEHLLASQFSLPQARILYELAHAAPNDAPSARDLAERLCMDTGFISRLVSSLESDGLLQRAPSPGNAKRLELRLTEAGRLAFQTLDAASRQEISALLAPLAEPQRVAVANAMSTVRHHLGDTGKPPPITLRDPEPGDMGRVLQQQAAFYAEEYGWNHEFEALVAEILGKFLRDFDHDCERCWIAEMAGEVVGSVFVVRGDEATAKLRLLYVDPAARGRGLGGRLVDECLHFAKDRGYRRMVLWTNDVLVSARRIYVAAGFELVEEEAHHSFGHDLIGQTWARDL